MLFLQLLLVALQALRAHAFRSFLTTLGIIIGIASVITMVSLGAGAQAQVTEEIRKRGANVMYIEGGERRRSGVSQGARPLSLEDVEALRDETGHYLLVGLAAWEDAQVTYLRWNSRNTVVGTWPTYQNIHNYRPFIGRFFTDEEVGVRRRVAVLGWNIPEKLHTPAPLLLGKTIQIKGVPFTVIAIMEEKGDLGRWSPDNNVMIPVTTAQNRVFGGRPRDRVGRIYVQAPSEGDLDQAYADIDRVMRRRLRVAGLEDPPFQITGTVDWLNVQQETNRTFTYLLMGIAGVSLLVGGIGIMNVMMVSVTERTREVGLRKAMGATRGSILYQFLVEALALCLAGGLGGILAGFGSATLLARLAEWDVVLTPQAAGIAVLFSAVVGLFFGIWPAARAARLDPIEALRHE